MWAEVGLYSLIIRIIPVLVSKLLSLSSKLACWIQWCLDSVTDTGRGHVKTEAEVGVGQPQAKNTFAPRSWRGRRNHGVFRGRQPAADALIVDFQSELSLFPQGRGPIPTAPSLPAPRSSSAPPLSPLVPAALEVEAASTCGSHLSRVSGGLFAYSVPQ